jgi:hypothetical protein
MVTFVSLFLWLVVDTQPVRVAVDPGVAAVELFLDDHSVGVIDGPPWQLECDFGPTLRPHELRAVARGEDGSELGRTTQLVNLPRSNAEVEIVLKTGATGEPDAVRVVTESGERLQPLAVFVTFDGSALAQSSGGRYELPDHDPRQIHIVSAEAHFPDGVTARQDVTFGGTFGSRVATELTAVPVFADVSEDLDPARLQGLFSVRGVPAKVAAVERLGARLYFVRDQGAWPLLQRLGRQVDLLHTRSISRRTMQQFRDATADPANAGLPADRDSFHLVLANPTYARGLILFPIGQPLDIKRWGLPWLATHVTSETVSTGGQRLAEAVAVAGVRAAGDGRPRAVVLVLSDNPVDEGTYGASMVRDYLQALHVPLEVWSVEPGEAEGAWGPVSDISDRGKLTRVSRRLMEGIQRQWVVWIEGRHLPSAIELAPNPLGLELAQ